MSVRRHLPTPEETELDMTPMLDIVFIMLIFFIVTTSFVKESGVTVSSPSAQSASQQESVNIFIAISMPSIVCSYDHAVGGAHVLTTFYHCGRVLMACLF